MTAPPPPSPWVFWSVYTRAGVVLLLLAWDLQSAELHQPPMPRNPSSAKECAICHYRWIDTFFIDGHGTDLAPLQTEQVEGTSEMCFSCHDGSVLDSRWAFEKERGHRSGAPPRTGMSVPSSFPLDAKGNIQCVTCHSAHGVSSVPGQSTSTFLRVLNTNSSICLLCHPTMAGNLAGDNHPVGPVTNSIPRELWSKHATPESAAHFITCETCHTAHANQQEFLLKQTVSDSTLCLTCHRDKNPINPDGTRNFYHAINVAPANAIIPATLITNGARLAKDGKLTCLTCHKIHQNTIEKHLLVAKNNNQSVFCFNCHTNKQGLLQNQHNLAQKFPDARNLAGKTVVESGPCSACHLPHKNARSLAGSGDAFAGLCLSCHGALGFAVKTNLLGRGHPTGIPLPAAQPFPIAVRPISLPLFDSTRHPSASGNITCLTCHDPHRPPMEGSPWLSAKLLRTDVSSLCRECHAHQVNVRYSKHDLSLASPTVTNVLGQIPFDSGPCSACHLMHSANNSTWARPGPPSSNPADKCRSCHRPDGLAAKKNIQPHSHPIDVSLQEAGLQTTLPLYFESSQTNAPGKMTCITCHDPHRWDPSALPAAADQRTAEIAPYSFRLPPAPASAAAPEPPQTEGSTRNSFLRLEVSPSPNLCANCHLKEARVVGTAHDLPLFAPDQTNLLGQRARDTGPCGACHLAHYAPIKSKLWARELHPPSPNTPLADAMCRACHSPQSVATKVPIYTFHPPVTVVNMPAADGFDRTFFPLFDIVSGRQVSAGIIACSSCHNVHQWSLRDPGPGPGCKVEGDSNSSFLRHRSAELPCKICHGLDAIYRYQYYHKSTTHQAPDSSGLDDLFR